MYVSAVLDLRMGFAKTVVDERLLAFRLYNVLDILEFVELLLQKVADGRLLGGQVG